MWQLHRKYSAILNDESINIMIMMIDVYSDAEMLLTKSIWILYDRSKWFFSLSTAEMFLLVFLMYI